MITRTGKRGPKPGFGALKNANETASKAWLPDVPDWIQALARACDQSSQTIVAKRLNYSSSVVSSILNRSYIGNLGAVEKAVRGALMSETLECPALGEIRQNVCNDHQRLAVRLQPTSSMRVRMYHACRGGCPHSRLSPTKAEVSDA